MSQQNSGFDQFIETELNLDLPPIPDTITSRWLIESRISPLNEIDQRLLERDITIPEYEFVYIAPIIFRTKSEEIFDPAIFYLHELAILLKKINDSDPTIKAKKGEVVYGEIDNNIEGLISSTTFIIADSHYGQIRGFKILLNNRDKTESCEISGEGFSTTQIKESMKLSSTIQLKNPADTFFQILEFISLSTEYSFSQNERH